MVLWISMESGITSDSNESVRNSRESRPAQPPPYWVFLPGLVFSAYVLVASAHLLRVPNPRGNKHAVIDLALLVFVPALAGPLFRALRRTVLASVCAVLVTGSYWAFCFFLLFIYSVLALLFFWHLFLPPLGFAIAATISLARRRGGQWAVSTVFVGFLCGMIGAATVQASKSAELNWVRPLDPVVLGPDMLLIDKCSQKFAASHSETGYPESLEQLGPSGTDCLPAALVQPQIKGFTITYEPGAKDSDGRIGGYSVKARETSPKGEDVSSMFTDESGRIHYRFDGPHGKGSTMDYFPAKEEFGLVLDCLWDASTNSTFAPFHEHADRLVTDRDLYVQRRLGERLFTGIHKFSPGGYNFEYRFTSENDGAINGFTVDVRPQHYGIDGIRSYLAVATIDRRTSLHSLNIHATPQNRSATLADPVTQPGEIKPPGYLSSEKPNN
jgi:hypothetical protein